MQTFEVSHIFTSPVRFRSAAYRRSMERLGKTSPPLTTTKRGDVLSGWSVMHPGSGDQFARADDGAVVVRASLQGTKVLLLSDLGPAGQAGLLEHTPNLRADIVVAGLPAVGEPLGEALIDAIQPSLIIVSDSELPVSERASPKLRARLKRRNIPILFTRDTGAVTLEFRKQHWQLQAMNGMECDSTRPICFPAQGTITTRMSSPNFSRLSRVELIAEASKPTTAGDSRRQIELGIPHKLNQGGKLLRQMIRYPDDFRLLIQDLLIPG